MADDAQIVSIRKEGEVYQVEGLHEGRKAGFTVAAQDFERIRKDGGDQLVTQFLKRQLPHTREDAHYDLDR